MVNGFLVMSFVRVPPQTRGVLVPLLPKGRGMERGGGQIKSSEASQQVEETYLRGMNCAFQLATKRNANEVVTADRST